MLVTSWSAEEYRAFFRLAPEDLAGSVLDCSAGASGFAAVVNAEGGAVTAVDPAYGVGTEELLAEAGRSAARGGAIVGSHHDRFVWEWYGSGERRDAMRQAAFAAFADDLRAHPSDYVAGALPELPFPDGAFDLAMCCWSCCASPARCGCSRPLPSGQSWSATRWNMPVAAAATAHSARRGG